MSVHRILLLVILSAASLAQAREDDFEQPIDVRADRSEYDEKAGVQTLEGNIEISQGSIRILADRIEITLKDNKLDEIRGTGAPIRFEQQNDAGETISGEAAGLLYEAQNGRLVLAGDATLSQPRQTLNSQRIVFDARNQTVRAEGGDTGRVNIRIAPPEARDAE